MAKRNIRSKVPPSQTCLTLRDPLSLALEAERLRLEQLDAVLGCLAHSLAYAPETEPRPTYAPGEVAAAARTLVRETLDRLDPTRLVQLMAASKLTYARAPKPC